MHLPGGVPTSHADTYARDLLPPAADWPLFDYSAPFLGALPDRLNAAAALIDAAVSAGYGGKPAFIYEGAVWTYAQLRDRADRIARVLVEDMGLVAGNRVLLRSGNSPMLAACWLAVLKAGGICVTTMPLLRARELAYIVEKARIRHALCEVILAEEVELARGQRPELDRVAYFTPLGAGSHAEARLDGAAAGKPAGFPAHATAADDIALISFTSGTTGQPKAAAHFHRDILAVSECWPRVYPVAHDEVVCGTSSFAFAYGVASLLICPLRHRATVVLTPRPAPDLILDAMARHRVTSLYAVPTAFNALLPELAGHDLGALRQCSSAGEHLRPALWERWRDATGVAIVNGLGMTEMLAHFLSESLTVERVGSTGRALPGYTACVLDDEDRPLPPGHRGRLAVRGPTGCRYLGDPDRQRAFVRQGWNVTGDIVEQDADGRFWYAERADDLIVSAGYNISAQEVEDVLATHPRVVECAVVGVPDPDRGSIVRACVVLDDPRDGHPEMARQLQDFVKATIAPYKYPRDIVFMDSLPRTPTGKLQRFRLRQG